ncbi:unnamed protein product, partial [Musa acuminata subsp. burmannicoides]
ADEGLGCWIRSAVVLFPCVASLLARNTRLRIGLGAAPWSRTGPEEVGFVCDRFGPSPACVLLSPELSLAAMADSSGSLDYWRKFF